MLFKPTDRHGSEHLFPELFANVAAFPATGDEGVLYADTSKVPNPVYRWDTATSAYVQIGGGGTPSTTSLQAQVFQGAAFVAAQANADANVADILLLSDGSRLESGKLTYTAHGLTVGAYYYLSQTVAGGITAVRPNTGLVQRVLFVEDANTLHVDVEPAEQASNFVSERIAQFVPLDTPVALDNIRIEARLTGGQGVRIGTVSGTTVADLAALDAYAVDAVHASNRPGVTLTTTMTHHFGWIGQTNGDMATGTIHDITAGRMYRFIVKQSTAPTQCFIMIERLL